MAENESKRNVKRIENRKAKDSKRELVLCNIAREKINRKTLAYLVRQYLSSIPYKCENKICNRLHLLESKCIKQA